LRPPPGVGAPMSGERTKQPDPPGKKFRENFQTTSQKCVSLTLGDRGIHSPTRPPHPLAANAFNLSTRSLAQPSPPRPVRATPRVCHWLNFVGDDPPTRPGARETMSTATAETASPATAEKALSVSAVARRIGANPRDISDLFYSRKLRDDLCPVVGGRRTIPANYIELIRAALKRAGRPVNEVARV
jgi:hypothetical protein